MGLVRGDTHACRSCGLDTDFTDRLCQNCGPDMVFERILQKFEHDSHALGFCMLCGTCIVYEGGNCVAAHKPGCLWGRAVKSSEFLSEAKIIFYGDLSESSFGRITFATDKELEGICREYVAAHTCENLDVKGESVCSIDWVSVSTLNSDGTAGADIAVYRYDYLDNDWKWEMK